MNENTEQTIEILEYATKLARAVNEVDHNLVDDLLGFDPEEATPLDYVHAARLVYADKRLADAINGLTGQYVDSDSVREMGAAEDREQTPEAPTPVQTSELRKLFMDTPYIRLANISGVNYYRDFKRAERVLETSVSRFVGFWCAECDAPHLLERRA